MRLLAHSFALLTVAAASASASTGVDAVYRVRFDATWSSSTHPGAYPAGAHFSPLIGGTHDASVRFWEAGGIASQGIETMAETGGTTPLRNEVQAAINAGQAGQVIDGSGTGSPGSVMTTFTATSDFPLATIVTMVAPSPDWFVGVDSVSLREGGLWVDQKVVDLYAWDAGTDSGVNFNSPNQNTSPQEPIALITGGPFFGTVPLGTFTFTRLSPDEIGTRFCSAVPNSTGAAGRMTVLGSETVAADDLTLVATMLPTSSNIGYFIMGTGTSTFVPPGSAGPICIAPGIKRFLPPVSNTNELPGGFCRSVGTQGPVSGHITPASTWSFQAWHRDSMAGTSNLTDAVGVTFL